MLAIKNRELISRGVRAPAPGFPESAGVVSTVRITNCAVLLDKNVWTTTVLRASVSTASK